MKKNEITTMQQDENRSLVEFNDGTISEVIMERFITEPGIFNNDSIFEFITLKTIMVNRFRFIGYYTILEPIYMAICEAGASAGLDLKGLDIATIWENSLSSLSMDISVCGDYSLPVSAIFMQNLNTGIYELLFRKGIYAYNIPDKFVEAMITISCMYGDAVMDALYIINKEYSKIPMNQKPQLNTNC